MASNIFLGRDFKAERYAIYALRGLIRIITYPLQFGGNTRLKHKVRLAILKLQNSLPIEMTACKGDVVMQIGTPRPRTIERFRKAVGDKGTVVVLEAEPENFARLNQWCEQQGYQNVVLVEAAAWSKSGRGTLSLSPFSGDHKVALTDVSVDNDRRSGNAEMAEIDCQFLTIDEVMSANKIPRLNYLSVTVNGGELEVLKGATETLSAMNVRVYAKGHALRDNGEAINVPIRHFLSSLGYNTIRTRGEPSSTLDPAWRWRAGDVYAWKNTGS